MMEKNAKNIENKFLFIKIIIITIILYLTSKKLKLIS